MLMAIAAGAVPTAFHEGSQLGTVMSRVNVVLQQHPPEASLMPSLASNATGHTIQ